MLDKLRCAVIGVGAAGLNHLDSLLHCRRAAAVAIAEPQAARAKESADRFKLSRSYSDYHELLEQPDIDAVTIAVPNHLHAPIALEALKARKHVLLERPMAMDAKEAAKIVETATRLRRHVMVGMPLRFNPQVQLARHAIQRGDLGEVYHVRGRSLRRLGIPRIGSWYTQRSLSGGGCVRDVGSSILDAALHLLGEFNATTVTAHTHARLGPNGIGESEPGKTPTDSKRIFDVEDYGTAMIKLKSGRTVHLEVSWAGYHLPRESEEELDVLGTAAGLSLFPAKLCRNTPNGYETIHLNLAKLPQPEDRIHHFVNCVLDDRKPLVGLDESVKVQQILDAIYVSAKSGHEVRLS